MRRPTRDRRGFTLVEMLVVAVLGTAVVGAAYQVLVVNQRTYTAQNAQTRNQQTIRAGMEVLFGELREVSASGGDILAMGGDTLKVRALRRFGVVCSVAPNFSTLRVMKVGRWFDAGDSLWVFADNRTNVTADDAWIRAHVSARDTTQSCGTNPAQELTVPMVAAAASGTPPDSVRQGAPVRSYVHYTYGVYTYNGKPYLARRESGTTTVEPLVGPLASTDGLELRFLDTLGTTTTTPTDVAQIELTLRTETSVLGPQGEPVADSIRTRIHTRN